MATNDADPDRLRRLAEVTRLRALLYTDDPELTARLLQLALCYEAMAETVERVLATRAPEPFST